MSPDAQLADRIARRLVADRLLAAGDAAGFRERLAAGQLTRAEWRELADAVGEISPAADGTAGERGDAGAREHGGGE